MQYKFTAYGHPNILATHKTTFEFTKDENLTLKGDCIVGVKADFDLEKLKEFVKKNKKITITIETTSNKKIRETISAETNPEFNDDKEIVVRKSELKDKRTLAIKADKSSLELKRNLINDLKNNTSVLKIKIFNSKN